MLVGAGALTAMGVLMAPGFASAHTAQAIPSCTGLEVKVFLYPDDTPIKVTIDGNTQNFAGSLDKDFPWDSTKDHTWHVTVTDPGFPFDKGGTQEACNPPETTTTTTVPETTTTVPETPTTVPETPTTPPTEPTTPPTEPTTPITQNLVTTTTQASSGGGGASSGGGSSSSGGGQLPSTGPSDAVPFAVAGLAALAGGSALVYVARRRGSTPS